MLSIASGVTYQKKALSITGPVPIITATMSTPSVLIVEDQTIIAQDLKTRLLKLGYHVVGIVASGEEAIRQAGTVRPDVALIDVALTGPLDGIGAAARIRSDCHIPIVFVAARSDELTLPRAGVGKSQDYVINPFDDSEIRSTIEIALYTHRLEQQLTEREARLPSRLEHVDDRAYDLTPQQNTEETLKRLFVAEQRHTRELAALNTAFHAMSSSLELKPVLEVVTSELQRLIGSESVSVLLRDGAELEFAAASGPGAESLIGTRMPATAGIAGAVLNSQTPSVTLHAETDQRFYHAIDVQTGLTTQTVLAVPLVIGNRAIGVMEAINKAPGSFDAHDLDLLVAIAGSAAIAIENARLYEAQREHNRRLQAAQPRLIQTEKMAALGRLAASLSHEINNPLQAVQGCLNLINEALNGVDPLEPDVQAEMQRDLQIALSEFDRVTSIVRRLRALYYASPPQPATTDVPAQIELVLDLAAQALADRLITVEQHYAPEETGELRVAADPDRFRHVLLTLVLSAIDSMPSGGTLWLAAELESRHTPGVRITVTDTGPQIPAEMLPLLFEPFQAARANDSSLGLSICYELIASLGGELSAENRPDAGVTLTIWLPSIQEGDFDE